MRFISDRVFKNLELDYIFSRITVYTPYGDTCKKRMQPYLSSDKGRLEEEFERIEKVVRLLEKHRYTFVEIRNVFKSIKDLRGSFKRIEDKDTLSTVELFEIKTYVNHLDKLFSLLKKLNWELPSSLSVVPIPSIRELLDPQNTGVNTFYIYEEYSQLLRDTREKIRDMEGDLFRRRVESRNSVHKDLDIKLRPNGEIIINKNNKEMLELIEKYKGLVYSSETYMNITYRVKTDEDEDRLLESMEGLRQVEEEEELKVRKILTGELRKVIGLLISNAEAIGELDLLMAKGYLAIGMKGTRPLVVDQETVHILEGRHIKVEDSLRKQDKEFTPITLTLKKGVTCITGANMGGKTISLKLIGLLSAMAQYGLFVPAEKMEFSFKDYIFFSLGDLQSVDMGLSTFGAEILEIKDIINRADEKGLILVDELARGTNPAEGYAISKAILSHLKDKQSITVVTTHFDGLTQDESIRHLQVKGLTAVDYKTLREEISLGVSGIEKVHQYMDYSLVEVGSENKVPRDAINIARIMGLQEEILLEAQRYLNR